MLHIRDGEIVGGPAESWVYVWQLAEPAQARADVLYVGATNAPPAVRTWLHLHAKKKEMAQVASRFPDITSAPVDVHAFRVPQGWERPQVKHALIHALAADGRLGQEYVGPPVEDVLRADAEIEQFVQGVLYRLYPQQD